MTHLTRLLSATALAAALVTAGCNRNPDATGGDAQARMALPALPATLPLEAGAATEIAPAPSASDLPDAKPLRLARVADSGQAYGYADAAYSYDEALGDAPPDYGFDYDGSDPWAWQGYDDSLMVAEPIDDGYRYYYYRPGADEPYFVRDPFYSYGYADGLLAVVYGADGGVVRYGDYGPRLIYASRYYARGRQLWGASRRGQRRGVIAANWVRQQPVIFASRDRWGAGRARQPEWRRYAEAERPRQTAYWSAEQVRRQADARRFDGWRQGGFRSAPPPRAIPVAWEKAKWAQDDRRYRPAAQADRDDRQNAGRRDDRPQADQRDARQDRQDDRQQQTQRDQRQAERAQAQQQTGRDQPNREGRRDQAQADRRDAPPPQQREARQAERQQAQQRDTRPAQQQTERARRQQADAGRQQAQREAQQGQRQAAQAQQREARQAQQRDARQGQQREARQAQAAERRPAQQPPQRPAAQAERRQAQQAQRAQAQQAASGQRREAQQGQRQQQQAEARQAQQAQRQEAQQGARQQQQAERQQAAQAQRQQAQAAERQQAQQAERQQQQAQREQAQQQRQQAQQQQRQQRRDARGPGPN